MAASKGNTLAKKLTTLELKKEAYRQYCEHIAQGKPKESWYFDHPEISLVSKSMEKYIREEPDVFPPIQKEKAMAASYGHWYQVCADSAKGKNEKANTASLQMIMRNIHGWDKRDDKEIEEQTQKLDKILSKLDSA